MDHEEAYRAGESNMEADIATLCDQLDIALDGRHPLEALRAEIPRLRGLIRDLCDPKPGCWQAALKAGRAETRL